MNFFVDVILPIPLARYFTYAISEEVFSNAEIGMRVAVPFGKTKIYTGIIGSIHQKPPEVYEAKDIEQLLDTTPIVTQTQLRHWEWMAAYYMCTMGEVVRSALPGAFLLESETLILKNPNSVISEKDLADDEFLVYEALQHQSALKIHEIAAIIDRKNALPVLNRLLAKQVILLKEELYEQYKPKLVSYVQLASEYTSEHHLEELLQSLSRSAKQSQVILALFQFKATTKKPLEITELEKVSKVSRAVIKRLITKGILEEYRIQTDRVVYKGNVDETSDITLNAYQQNALARINSGFAEKKVVLLHGVTSSGKTEVYIKLIEDCVAHGKQVLYLVPEIALTTQLIGRLQAYFGEKVSVYHSRYSAHERVEVWNNVLVNSPKTQVVIGARSAMFLPFRALGLLIVDEEHEASFKQFDPAPRYHARDAAIVLANYHDSKVVLGSATPSLESFYNVSKKKYAYASIEKRYGDVLLPEIELIDLKEALRKKRMKGHFSETLCLEIEAALKNGGQIILFQNRRGYAPVVECTTCGHCPQCPNCDVSLTYHQQKKQLRCHYCGYHIALQESCQACGSFTLDTKGFGTEQVEQELNEIFPDALVGRMDLDTTRGKHGYEKIIAAFEKQEIDILVGTQMLTKGLDFRNVSVVGIMNADAVLNFPDFKAHERSFQLLVQVGGRAGRTKKRGKVLIQTYNPQHAILKQVLAQDYDAMFKEQMHQREQYQYPPLVRLIKITFKHKDYNKVNEAADWFAKSLRNVVQTTVLGPEFPAVARIRNQFLKDIIIKWSAKKSVSTIKKDIKRIEKSFNAISFYRGVRVIYNVDHI
ncbi:primosomal protein N' [Arenibacter sp. GZD96]|uniref:replication restart helicase PriA n=1 Tax=Aurantibrevibacter litoralis TaxID=3106030 RepID=UPI002AFEEFCF|nr:primosomal protein N' [Arenibacter sp. GZD-96]MEA1786884.1 primosomal protein N' [Arenibacter sp. GZD-96]